MSNNVLSFDYKNEENPICIDDISEFDYKNHEEDTSLRMDNNGLLLSYDYNNDDKQQPALTNSNNKKRKVYTIETKFNAIYDIENNSKTVTSIAHELGIAHSTVSTWVSDAEKIKSAYFSNGIARKKVRNSRFENIDQALCDWCKEMNDINLILNGAILKAKAKEFAELLGENDFKASNGWIERFKKRNSFLFCPQYGNSTRGDLKEDNNYQNNDEDTFTESNQEEDETNEMNHLNHQTKFNYNNSINDSKIPTKTEAAALFKQLKSFFHSRNNLATDLADSLNCIEGYIEKSENLRQSSIVEFFGK